MPTGQQIREAQQFLKESGYSVQLIFTPAARAQWYRADGTEVPGLLPVDPYHMGLFRKNGWGLQPPAVITPAPPTEQVGVNARMRDEVTPPVAQSAVATEVTPPVARPRGRPSTKILKKNKVSSRRT